MLNNKFASRLLGVMAAGFLATTASFAIAQESTPELEAWLQANKLGAFSDGTEDWDDIVAKARLEGQVSIYSSSGRIAKLVDNFNQLYPEITLTLFDLGSVKTIEKTVREQNAGIFSVDVITTGNSGQVINELLKKGRIYNYVPAQYIDNIPVENRDPLLIRVNEAIVFFYNTEKYPDGAPVSNIWELTEERFKGVVGIKDPMGSGSSLMGLATLVQHPEEMAAAYKRYSGKDIVLGDGVPDAGYEFVARILANDAVIFKSGTKLAGASGARDQENPLISFTNMTYISRNVSEGWVNAIMTDLDPVSKLVYPTFMAVAREAPNPNAAKVLIAYLLGSPELTADMVIERPYLEGKSFELLQGLAPYYDAGSVSPRSDVPLPEGGEIWDEMEGWVVSEQFMWRQAPRLRDFWLLNASQ